MAHEYKPIAGGALLMVSNTESDVLRDLASQKIFVLLSGRWFASATTEGPWEFVRPDELPEGFQSIDPDGDYGYLLAWVAGTAMTRVTSAPKAAATIELRRYVPTATEFHASG